MNTFTEPVRSGEFLLAEVNPHFRENGTIAEGQKLAPGTVVAKNAEGEFVQLDDTVTEVASGILHSAVDATEAAKPGIVVARLAVVADSSLTWPAEITEQGKAAAIAKLAESLLIVR